MQLVKIHFAASLEMIRRSWSKVVKKRLKARILTAVKVSTAYTAADMSIDSHRYAYANGVPHDVHLKSCRDYSIMRAVSQRFRHALLNYHHIKRLEAILTM